MSSFFGRGVLEDLAWQHLLAVVLVGWAPLAVVVFTLAAVLGFPNRESYRSNVRRLWQHLGTSWAHRVLP